MTVRLIAIAFLYEMNSILFEVFLDPSKRFLVGEPNRWVSGLEVVLGVTAMLVLCLEVILQGRAKALQKLNASTPSQAAPWRDARVTAKG